MEKKWYCLAIDEIQSILKANFQRGLTEAEAKIRLKKFGFNQLPEEKPLSKVKIFFEQFQSPLVYILIIAGIVTLLLKENVDAVVIFTAVLLDAVVGFLQENKAGQILKTLKKAVKNEAEVLRDGNLKIIDASQLVPGDIIILTAGSRIPADGRIFESHDLKVNEMALTGEWLPAEKRTGVLDENVPLADRDNLVYSGTMIEDGKGRAVVTATGLKTEIGKIAAMLKETREEKTPYQKKIANFSRTIGIIISIVCLIIFIEGILTEGNWIEMFVTAVAIAVAAIPEGLPVAMTVILAVGMQRILKKGGLVRRLASAETLGSTSIIATDKTATLTEGKMKVVEVIGDKSLILKTVVLTSQAFIENPEASVDQWIVRGESTDQALLLAAITAGFNKDELDKHKIAEMPFNPANKLAATVLKEAGRNNLYVCGAPEAVLALSQLTAREGQQWKKKLDQLAGKGLRIVAAGYKTDLNSAIDFKEIINNLTFTGLIALRDPVRPEVKEAINLCRQAGMRPIIITGDHKLTAKAVAEELDWNIGDEDILEGKDLDKLNDDGLDKILTRIQIYARVEPKDKMRIITAWQKRGKVVAMIGDGVNDAPALKKADIGVALGSGTEVAKEAADLILLNDSFAIIVAAVEEGRAILDNIRKVITYLLSDTFSEVVLVGVSILAGVPLPITAVQILWINLMEDGLGDIALAFEPKEEDLMKQKPQGHDLPLLTKEMKTIIFIIGLITDLILLGLFFWLWRQNYPIDYIRSIIFTTLTIDSLLYIFSCKSLRKNIWQVDFFSNKLLLVAFGSSLLMLILALYFPFFQNFLEIVPLGFYDWLIVLGLGLVELLGIEAAKWFFISQHQTA